MKKQLTPRQHRIHTALIDFPEGILSFTLRHICGCMNISDEVVEMRELGFNITCEMEPYITQDGAKTKIGRYKLLSQGGQI